MLRKCMSFNRISFLFSAPYKSLQSPNKLQQFPCNFLPVISPKFCSLNSNQDTTNDAPKENVTNADDERKLKVLTLEMSVLRQEGRRVPDPDLMKQQYWDHLLGLATRSARSKYYSFLWSIEKKKEGFKTKKQKKKAEYEEKKSLLEQQNIENPHIIYSLMHTTFLLRIYDATMNLWDNNKLNRAMQFGQKLILDCSYDEHMNEREAINAAKQLMLVFAENRMHNEPFDLYFCNTNFNQPTMQYLHKHIPTLLETWFPLNVHECSYLDMFPKEQLVYLTPHCNNDLNEYSHDHVYIIGAMVDKYNNEPLSLAKAKKLGLKMARLPLDRYLQWGGGSGKSLTLNQMTSVLLDIKSTGDWNKALKHVPRRKIVNEHIVPREVKKWEKNVDKFKVNLDALREPKDFLKNISTNSVTTKPVVNKFRKQNWSTSNIIKN